MNIRITGLHTLPEINPLNDLGEAIRQAALREQQTIGATTILVVAQKVVSKAEGALVDLRTIQPSDFARRWAEQWNKDGRAIELILRESKRVVRMDRGVILSETRHGFIAANAGVDQSNIPEEDFASVLPKDPDASAQRLRRQLACGAVIITDTFGRPWREGLVNIAIGVAGIEAVRDLRGSEDRDGRRLKATILATADELAAAGGLVMDKAGGVPVALIEGYEWEVAEGSSKPLIRAAELDMFR